MLILGLDTSQGATSVALYEDGNIIQLLTKYDMVAQSERLMVLVDEVMRKANKKSSQLDRIIVARGPGSFTGIRVGISTALGLAAPFDTMLTGVSTLRAMAYNAGGGLVCVVLDARRNNVYTAVYDGKNELLKDCNISADELASWLLEDGRPVTLVGDGAEKFLPYLSEKGVNASMPEMEKRYANAASVIFAGLEHEEEATPSYLRITEAERNLEKKNG